VPAESIETRRHPVGHLRRLTSTEEKSIVLEVGIEADSGRRRQSVEGDRQRPHGGDVVLDIALAPVLHKGDVRMRDGGSLHCVTTHLDETLMAS
jgi:hypothetical protein